jgi:hypothetical protein
LETSPPLPSAPGTFTELFEASWLRISFDTATICDFEDQMIEIICKEGNSIKYLGPIAVDSLVCEQTATDTLQCVDSGVTEAFVGAGSGAKFECSGPVLAGATNTLKPTTANCDVVADEGTFDSRVILATECDGGQRSTGYFLDCTTALDGGFQTTGSKLYICYSAIEMSEFSTGAQSLNMPSVVTSTNLNWADFAQGKGCYTFEAAAPTNLPPTSSSPPSAPVPVPATPGGALGVCESEETAANDCVNNSPTPGCVRCIQQTFNGLTPSNGLAAACQNVEDEICFALTTACPCFPCEDEIEGKSLHSPKNFSC